MHRGRVPSGRFRSIVRMQSTSYTVYRPTGDTDAETDDGWGEQPSSLSGSGYTSHTGVELDLFEPRSAHVQYPTGTDANASLQGVALPSADVEEGDVIPHGNTYYVVETVDGWPNDQSPEFVRLPLDEDTSVSP